jgi:DNA-binding response OmpR family regulator
MNLSKKKILLIEDDLMLVKAYEQHLSNGGYEVSVEKDGSKAIEKIKEIKPDLILLDVLLPSQSGIEILKKIKEEQDTSNCKVIVISNVSDDDTLSEVMELGVTNYFVKSEHSLDHLISKVEEVLSK